MQAPADRGARAASASPLDATTRSAAAQDGGAGAEGDLTLGHVFGADYEAAREADEEHYWEAHDRLEDMVAWIGGRSPGAAVEIANKLATSNQLLDDIRAREDDVIAAASAGAEGDAQLDVAIDVLWLARDDLDSYARLFAAEADLWGLLLTLPFMKDLDQVWSGWVEELERFDVRIQSALARREVVVALLAKHREELREAYQKTAVDGLRIFADVLLLTTPVSGPIGGVAGAAAGLVGWKVGSLIEPGETTTRQGYMNGALTAADIARQAREARSLDVQWMSPAVVQQLERAGLVTGESVVTPDRGRKQGGLGRALDALSGLRDGLEAGTEARTEAGTEARPETGTETGTEARIEAKIEARTEAKIEARIEAKIEARTEAKIGRGTRARPEARIRQQMVIVLEQAVAAWSAAWTRMLAVWPEVARCLDAAVPFLDRLHHVLAISGARMDAALAQVNAARARLH